MKKWVLIIIILSNALIIFGQYYSTGVEPFSTKWKQISTERIKIVFPESAEKIAINYLYFLNIADSSSTKDYYYRNKKLKVVLHNNSILSNGFVAWAPKRMEIITQSPFNINSQLWLKQLAVHETRHYAQVSNLYNGIFYPLYFLFGEQAIGASAGFVPMWYLEGDAVAFETATSNSGRGRQAEFYNYYRAHYLTKTKPFKYDKWLLGSYKDNIPNHYSLGYQMVTYGKFKYGKDVWLKTLKYVSFYPFTIFPFYFGLKAETGRSRKSLHDETFRFLDSLWTRNQETRSLNSITKLTTTPKEYTEYHFTYPLNDSILITYKSNLSQIPSFNTINIKTQREEIIVRPGYLTSRPSFSNNTIYWSEYSPHLRWEYQDYSIIKAYNLLTKSLTTITKKGKHFSPVVNQSNGILYALLKKEDGESQIVGISTENKQVSAQIIPDGYDPFELFISQNGNIYIAAVTNKGKVILEKKDNTFERIFGPTWLDINSCSCSDNLIFFNLTLNYNEDIYCYNILNNKLLKVITTNFGSKNPIHILHSNSVLFSEFSDAGYGISSVPLDTLKQNITLPSRVDDPLTTFLDNNEPLNIDSIDIKTVDFKISNYRGIQTFFNVHSWMPFFVKQDFLGFNETPFKPGFMLLSQNLKGSSILTFGYGYDNGHNLNLNYEYSGLWPKLSILYENYTVGDTSRRFKLVGNIMIPFQLSQSHYSTFLAPIFSITHTNDFLSKDSTAKSQRHIESRLFFTWTERMAKKDIRPRNGLLLNLESISIAEKKAGVLIAVNSRFYLPGIAKNHSLMMSLNLQEQWIKNYIYSSKVIFPRGYESYTSKQIKSISVDYMFPFFYPDFAAGSLVYFKRLSMNLFFDYAKASTFSGYQNNSIMFKNQSFQSVGFEVYSDFHLFRTRYPLRLKFQQGWMSKNYKSFGSLTLVTDIYSALGLIKGI